VVIHVSAFSFPLPPELAYLCALYYANGGNATQQNLITSLFFSVFIVAGKN
jgi:hypothetical protein